MISSKKCIPAYGILIERIVLTFPSQPSTLTAVAVEKRSAGPTHKRDLKWLEVKGTKTGLCSPNNSLNQRLHKESINFQHQDVVKDIEGSPLSNLAELPASISRSAETISTLCVVNIPAT